ncbi:MAG: zinc-ribbon domain-containing protein [Blastocatellia bacterium]
MFCPRCGTQNSENTKFCRQCGLGLAPLSGYLERGGTGALASPPAQKPPPLNPGQLPETSEMLALKQKKVLTILAMCILPIVATILGEELFNGGEFLSVGFILLPLGITWAIFRYKTQLRRLQEEQLRQYQAAAQPVYSGPMAWTPMPDPAFQRMPSHAHLPPPPTNPLNLADSGGGSVIEDETRKLPIEKR